MDEVAQLKDVIQPGEAERRDAEEKLRNALLVMPNLPKDDVPAGEDESDNVEYFGPNGNAATAAEARPPKPSFSLQAEGAFRDRRSARHDGFRGRREDFRRRASWC